MPPLREKGNDTPILMLTAKNGDHDLAEALDTGADDYLSKPFSFVVLVARLRALLRRGGPRRAPVLHAGVLCSIPPRAPARSTAIRSTSRPASSRCSSTCCSASAPW